MRRITAMAATLALTLAACGGAAAPPTSAAPSASPTTTQAATTTQAPTTTVGRGFTATSDDGRVTIDVPPGALATDPGIAMTRLDSADQPDEVADLPAPLWVYALEPGELQFDTPVRLSVEIPFDEFVTEGFEDATPLATMVTTSSDGTGWELLGDQTIRRHGDTITISGTTDHFSRMAVLHEQVFIETRFIEVNQDDLATIGIDFRGMNGDPLIPPGIGFAQFASETQDANPTQVGYSNGQLTLPAPPGIPVLTGDLQLDLQLNASEDSSNTGLTSAPKLTTIDQTTATIEIRIELVIRPTISADGNVRLDISVDHPGGDDIVPGGDFLGGLSAMYMILGRAFPGLYVGLICDIDGDGLIGPQDIMYPPMPATVSGDTTMAVLPLYGYGDYFPYFLDGTPPAIRTQVTVAEGATILLGSLTRQQTAVPALNKIPYLSSVLSSESTTSEDVELLVFITPRILEETE